VIEYMVVLARLAADGSVLGDVGSLVRAISSFVSLPFVKRRPFLLHVHSQAPLIGTKSSRLLTLSIVPE
jgi:hypothetical protein